MPRQFVMRSGRAGPDRDHRVRFRGNIPGKNHNLLTAIPQTLVVQWLMRRTGFANPEFPSPVIREFDA
jgi:hypothetical protein